MSKLNHNRPQIRLTDNIRRELAREGSAVETELESSGKPITPMPRISPELKELLHEMLGAFQDYLDAYSAVLDSLSPGRRPKAKHRKRLQTEQNAAKFRLRRAWAAILLHVLQEQSVDVLQKWLTWFHRDLRDRDRGEGEYLFEDLMELGLRPVMEAVSANLKDAPSEV